MLASIVAAAIASAALAQGAPGQEEPNRFALTPNLIEEANQAHAEPEAFSEVDTEAAHELPHTGLDQGQALNLLTSVFGEAVEAPAGVFDEVPDGKFIGTNAEIISSESAAELAEGENGSGPQTGEAGPALIESTTPLRVEDDEGNLKPVDLGLEHAEGELQAENPIVPVGIPSELGDGVELGEGGIGISFPAAAGDREPTVVEGSSAFYANVQEDTDLLIAPMPTGIETMTQIRSAEAPRTQVVHVSVPPGASLVATEVGGAEVKREGRQLMEVTPATAVDAAGEAVPATISVSGDQLRIAVEPGADATYPILVDPNYRNDEYNWVWGGSGLAGWGTSETAPGYRAQGYYASWHAIDLWSGFNGAGATPNTGAQWYYLVPRASSDLTTYGAWPTSWIEEVHVGGMMYLYDYGATTFPEIVSGIINPVEGGWVNNWIWNGAWGEITGWAGSFALVSSGNRNAKEFVYGLITLENEAAARLRETEAAAVTFELRDEDTPKLKAASLASPPSGWVNTGEYSLAYEAEDTGLGVADFGVEVEGLPSTAHVVALPCNGTNQSPCPRVAKSTEAGRPAVKLNAAEAPTGRDWFQVHAYDPLYGYGNGVNDLTPHVSSGNEPAERVELKVDHTPPAISLSGPLTEQEELGTVAPEFPMNIAVTDGEDGSPQSGLASVEVKVDGKKVTMPNETPWHPACTTQNCSFSGTWTLKASGYALGSHEVEVIAKDTVGLETREVQEVELGVEPLQTRFISPHPTFETTGLSTVAFKATREAKPVEGATFRCSLDGAPASPCTTPYSLPEHFKDGWHTFTVAAVDKGGIADPTPATWKFETAPYPTVTRKTEKLVLPESGDKTASYYTLEAEWGENPEGKAGTGVTGVTFQMELPSWGVFRTVPAECTIDGHGRQVSWPLPARSHPGHSAPVYLKVRGCTAFEAAGYPEKEVQFRAVFDGGEKVAGASEPAMTEFVYRANANRVSTDATEAVGPASVDLLTGAFTVNRTDVSIPVPGYESNLEFTRTYSSTIDPSLQGYSTALGGAWQPSSPLEAEGEGEAWSRIVEQVIPYHEAVYEDVCWEEKEQNGEFSEPEILCPAKRCTVALCQEWIEEEEQPREEWIELVDNEGAAVIFQIANGNYIAPEYARELKLTRQGANFVLGYPNGTLTTFVVSNQANEWLPEYISYQSSPTSMRLVYKHVGANGLKLEREIAPAPVACPQFESEGRPGCRTLAFEYQTFHLEEGRSLRNTEKLVAIKYYGPSGVKAAATTVAEYTYALVSAAGGPYGEIFGHQYEELLASERDPRLPISAERYTYDATPGFANLLATATPPGQEPWAFEYEYGSSSKPSRLKAVKRGGAKTTLAYGVPVSGAGAPYAMSPESVATWGQTDIPVDATAIFPPTHVPTKSPPTEYTGATVHYMDPDGYQVNVASPSPPGITGASIATTETDVHGDVVRELDPQNRLYAMEASNTAARSHELDTHSVYNAAGTELLESWGPLHKVRLASGEPVDARQHSVTRYDEEEPTPPAGTPWAFLPTKETVGVVVPGKEGEFEAKTTETKYRWDLRKPTKTIIDPGGLKIQSVTEYNTAGQVIESRQPKEQTSEGKGGLGAGTTRTIYYKVQSNGECESARYANLPCKVMPAAQASGTGRPKLLVKEFTAYDDLDEPEVVKESAGGEGAERISTTIYDKAGRVLTTKLTGGGVEVPKTETEYSPTLGLPEQTRFACEGECATSTPKYVSAIGESGSGNGQLSGPRGVAVDNNGHVWVVDRPANRIEEFSESGTFLLAFGKSGTGNGEFANPWGIAIDPGGNVWVADSNNCRIQEFNPEGKFLQKFGTKATGPSQGTEFVRPDGIAIAPGGKLWVTDNGGPRVAEFRRSVSSESERFVRNVAGTLPSGSGPEGVAVDSRGDVWFTEENPAAEVREYDREGNFIRTVGSPGGGSGQFSGPAGIAIAPSGNIVVSDSYNNREEEFNPTGTFLRSFGTGTGGESFSEPKGIAITPAGVAFVVDKNRNQVKKWNLDAGFNDRATTSSYDGLGRPVEYEDADGNKSETTYDAYGRPVTVTDARGSRTVTYDSASGLPTKLEVSGVGTFTARYDADGDLVETTLPNGLSRKTTYNAAGEPMTLAYTKASSTWFKETLERGADGRILADSNTLANDLYLYDKAGRLTESSETPTAPGATCTSRAYAFDADSNRLTKTTTPGVGGMCAKSGGATQNYGYDDADRLMGTGIVYDAWGRTEKLPGSYSGGPELVTKYFSTDMVATQTQGSVTNSFQLDASGRQRQRDQTGGVMGVEVFHYDSGSDSPSWTALGSTWSRNVPGIGGELAAVQESSGTTTTTFKLTNLHGDVVASASSSLTATEPLASYRFSEFGEPISSGAGRFGWLGGKSRRTELASGVIQMGARSYIPQLGRFLTPDPVRGGSANAYDYVYQDPVGNFDLNGERCGHRGDKKGCGEVGNGRGPSKGTHHPSHEHKQGPHGSVGQRGGGERPKHGGEGHNGTGPELKPEHPHVDPCLQASRKITYETIEECETKGILEEMGAEGPGFPWTGPPPGTPGL